ncbi:MAG TPA: ABC transporter substrate-binding protein [Actinomycetota bacterium]|nr:ABC transporter substrate-binding protein [Actinomycetota bacterium]
MNRTVRLWASTLALLLLTSACSGGAMSRLRALNERPDAAANEAPELEELTDQAPVEGAPTPEQAPESGAPGAPGRTTGTVVGGTRVTRGGTTVTTPPGGGPPVADLFNASEDRIGLTDNSITLCGHAATTFGPAFNTAPEDLNVYWQQLNDAGGVHGRRVTVSWENDNYDPTTATQAAEACRAKNPFILLGGIGFDQIPAVRNLVEQRRMLYIHHIAREDLSKKYSFSYLATVDNIGTLAAQFIHRKYPGKRVGVFYRNSENWDPGYKNFVSTTQRLSGKTPFGVPVERNQGQYTQGIQQMRNNADIVFVWENALAGTQIIQQAQGQGWRPNWLVFPFNTTTDTLGRDTTNPPLDGIATWPAYSVGDRTGPFASYADEIERFESAYRRYRNVPLTDIHWMTWLSWKQIHALLDKCGRDCTRNKIAGLILTGQETAVHPTCAVDFKRNGHVGGFSATIFEAYNKPGNAAGWRHQGDLVCRESFL